MEVTDEVFKHSNYANIVKQTIEHNSLIVTRKDIEDRIKSEPNSKIIFSRLSFLNYTDYEKYNYIQKVELYLDGEPTKEFYQYDLKVLKDGFSYKNAVLDLNVRLYPNNGSYKSVTWESSNELISVTEDGKCTPTKNESCYGLITCTVEDHFGNKYQDTVWVTYAFNPVT